MTPSQKRRKKMDQRIAAGYRRGWTVERIIESEAVARGTVFAALAREGVALDRQPNRLVRAR